MLSTLLLSVSTLLQFASAYLAIRLVPLTRRRMAWILIALALVLMGARRSVTLYDVISGNALTSPDTTAELIALVISIVMLVGVHLIGSVFAEMKKTERALRESENNFRSFFDSMNDLIVVTDLEGKILHTNRAAEFKLRCPQEDLCGTHLLDWHEPTKRREAEEIWAAVIAGETRNCPLPLLAKDGRLIPVESRAWLGRWDGRDSVFGICKDLTAQQEAEQRFEQLFRHNPLPLSLSALPEGRFLTVNEAFIETTGYSAEEVHGRTPEELGLITDPERFAEAVEQLIRDRRFSGFQLRLRRKDGTFREGQFSGGLISSGGQSFFLVSMLDVTERQTAEAALRASEARNRAIVSAIPDLLFRFDREGRFLDFHASDPASLAVPPEICLGRLAREVLPLDLAELTERKIVEVLSRKGPETYRYSLPDGTRERRYEARMVPYGPEEVLTFVRDVTEIERAEEQRLEIERRIQQTQKLESLGVLAGGIAHDFNNLLMAILGHADLALDELSPTSPARDSIEQIETASRRAAELCRQMLAYSGRGSFVIEPFDLGNLIEEMTHLLKTSISKKALLNLQLEKGLPLVKGDITQIRQVLMNLVINASEAIGDQSGVIGVTTGALDCNPAELPDVVFDAEPGRKLYVLVEVSDTGCGMDRSTRERLFEPFFTTKFTGRGLGMSAVLGIVRGHRGALQVRTEPGKGSTFRVLLPAELEKDSVTPRDIPERPLVQGREVLILLVDDEEPIRTLGRRMLERIGFRVITAADGNEALGVYRERGAEIGLVVLDLTMPNMDGAEAARALKQLDPTVRIILSSGYSQKEIESRFTGQDLLGFIQKPYTMSVLKERLFPIFAEVGEAVHKTQGVEDVRRPPLI